MPNLFLEFGDMSALGFFQAYLNGDDTSISAGGGGGGLISFYFSANLFRSVVLALFFFPSPFLFTASFVAHFIVFLSYWIVVVAYLSRKGKYYICEE